MKKILVGNTGLVGSVLKTKVKFDYEFNSKTIEEFSTTVPNGCDLFLTCLPATKWLVNQNVVKDYNTILDIISILRTKKYNKVYLISTIDVYSDSPEKSNEDYNPNFAGFSYGANRLLFEHLIDIFIQKEHYQIFRLPALFTNKLKKNILFDLLTNNQVEKINTNSSYQWYNLEQIYDDILKFSEKSSNEKIINLFPEPLETQTIVDLFPEHKDKVQSQINRVQYNFTTKLYNTGYIKPKEEVLNEIKTFISEFSR